MRFGRVVVTISLLFLVACNPAERYAAEIATKPTVEIAVPAGAGPFPAVVLMHNCGGLDGAGSEITLGWRDFLLANGYAVVLPDSFRPRGRVGGVCTLPAMSWIRGETRGADAHVALAAARNDPRIDGRRVAVMGGSNGGVATLAAANADLISDLGWAPTGGPGFAAAIAFYPECGINYGAWQVKSRGPVAATGSYRAAYPVDILIGELDDWTPVSSCTAMVAAASGARIDMKVYPDAQHGFDSNVPVRHNPRATNINRPGIGGATTGGHAPSWEDSRRRVLAILAARMPRG